jgi:flagellar protein FliO/FliZ
LASLKIEETKPLGNRQFLVVASYEGQKFLLGVVPGRVDFLSALKAEEGTGKTTR